jgi:CheY-like chemotaxis protein
MIVAALELEGYRGTGVGDTPAALDQIRRRRPDLIITDYHLPGQDGLDLLRALQAEGFGDIPALVISADVRPPDVPASTFIPKPFELDAILRAVRRALGRPDPGQPQQSKGGFALATWLRGPELAFGGM